MEIQFSFWILAFLASGGLVYVWSFWVEPNWFHLKQVKIRVHKPLREPLRILHLSDLHLTKPRFFLERFFNRLSRLEFDFVFLTTLFLLNGGIEFGVLSCKNGHGCSLSFN